jgi:DNA mismatch repair protein MutL
MYEFLCARVLASGSLESQRLLVPTPVETGSRDAEKTLGTLGPLLAAIGIEAQLLSPTCLGVLAFPSFLTERGVEIGAFMLDLFRKVEAGEFDLSRPAGDRAVREEALRDVLDMMSCKAAVKAGDRLRGEELEDLVRLREDVERSSNCPHGRPTSIRLTFKELEKLFGRA